MNRIKLVAGLLVGLMLSACAGTVPASYTPQSYTLVGHGAVAIGDFRYMPYEGGKVKANQIQNTALGQIYIATEVASFVQRATALELTRGGLIIQDGADLAITGAVQEFKADDLGWSVDWTYSIHYTVTNRTNGAIVLDKVYVSRPTKTGKFGAAADFSPSLNAMVLSALEQFMDDLKATGLFV